MKVARLKIGSVVELSPLQIAEAFCQLGDEEMAQVFIEAARIAEAWRDTDPKASPGMQFYLVGRHLRTCECSTEEARELIREIGNGIGPGL